MSYRHPDLLARNKTPVRLENRKTNKDFFYNGEVVPPVIHMTATPLIAPKSNPVVCWDKLPGEIRNHIYRLVAGDDGLLVANVDGPHEGRICISLPIGR